MMKVKACEVTCNAVHLSMLVVSPCWSLVSTSNHHHRETSRPSSYAYHVASSSWEVNRRTVSKLQECILPFSASKETLETQHELMMFMELSIIVQFFAWTSFFSSTLNYDLTFFFYSRELETTSKKKNNNNNYHLHPLLDSSWWRFNLCIL